MDDLSSRPDGSGILPDAGQAAKFAARRSAKGAVGGGSRAASRPASGGARLLWRARSQLGPKGRARVRQISDPILGPLIGSVRSSTCENRVALTLDDGPDADVSPQILDLLQAVGATATFFLLSARAVDHPDLVLRMAREGHEVALHGADHRPVNVMGRREVRRYLTDARATLEDIVCQPVRRYRPPYGAQSLGSYLGARQAGLEVVVWSADAGDWLEQEASGVARAATSNVAEGGILLLHERAEPSPIGEATVTTFDRVAVVRAVVEGLRAQGLRSCSVEELARCGTLRRTAWFRP